jgi:hypothetical protein
MPSQCPTLPAGSEAGKTWWQAIQFAGRGEKGYHFGGEVAPRLCKAVRHEPFPLVQKVLSERPGAVKGAPLLGAAQRTLDGEDRSAMIAEEGKAGRNIGETRPPKWYPRPPPLTHVADKIAFHPHPRTQC